MILLPQVFFLSCSSGSFKDGVFSNRDVSYRIGEYSGSWQVTRTKGVNLTFTHTPEDGLMIVHSRCGKGLDEPLATLIEDLFLEVNQTEILSSQTLTLDGMPALRVHHRIVQKIAVTESDTVLVKEGTCIFWLQLVAKPENFHQLQNDFVKFFHGFTRISGK